MMKKMIFTFFVLGGFILLGTNDLTASENEPEKKQTTQTARPGFVDSNGDGICDYYDGNRPGKGKGPGNGQGLGRADGKGLGQGSGLMNGSGNGQRKLDGTGRGRNAGNGRRDGSGVNCRLRNN
jgi:hypothetical protein